MHDSSSEKPSWTEKAGLTDSDQEPPEDVPDYDDLIESTLDSLDVYQAHRADMNRHLKTAFFNLAQAKLALGPARVGPASYHHGRIEPLLTVDISTSLAGEVVYKLVEVKPNQKSEIQAGKGKERATGSVIDLRYHGSSSALKLEDSTDEKAGASTVKKRAKSMFGKKGSASQATEDSTTDVAGSMFNSEKYEAPSANGPPTSTGKHGLEGWSEGVNANDTDGLPPTYSDTVNEYLLDPMQQFSAFPPVTLRKAQSEFRHSLRLASVLLGEQQIFTGMSDAVEDARGGSASLQRKG